MATQKATDGLTWTGHKGPWGRNLKWTCDQVAGLTIHHCGHPTALRPYYINCMQGTFPRLDEAKQAAARAVRDGLLEAMVSRALPGGAPAE